MKQAPVKRGDVLAGKYRVESVLGVGGMGVVVEATHLELNEPRALKFMLPEALENAESVERFLREARAASRLRSEHVARVYDVGRLDNGSPYMVMEYLEGVDLRALIKQRGRIPVHEAVLYALQACEALAEAHANGIVHRDLKPANLFLTLRPDGSPSIKVLDFGVSKILGGSDLEMTKTQAVLGSPTYMSPEQMRSARNVNARTDIWSLGVLLYRMVTGELPFRAENITELISMVLAADPEPPSSVVSDLPPGLDDVLLRCLDRDLSRRYSNVGELSSALVPYAPDIGHISAERIGRLLAGASLGNHSLPAGARRTGRNVIPAMPITGPSTSPWSKTLGPNISIQRRTFVAVAAIAGGLAIAGIVSLVISIRLGARHLATASASPPVATQTSVPQKSPAPATATPAATSAPTEAPTAASANAPELQPTPTAPQLHGKRPPRVKATGTAAELPTPPAATATAPHRMFGTDN